MGVEGVRWSQSLVQDDVVLDSGTWKRPGLGFLSTAHSPNIQRLSGSGSGFRNSDTCLFWTESLIFIKSPGSGSKHGSSRAGPGQVQKLVSGT